MSQEDLEEFNEIFQSLNVDQKQKVNTILINYKIPKEDFGTKFETYKYNLSKTRSAAATITIEEEVIKQIETDLFKQQSEKNGKANGEYQ